MVLCFTLFVSFYCFCVRKENDIIPRGIKEEEMSWGGCYRAAEGGGRRAEDGRGGKAGKLKRNKGDEKEEKVINQKIYQYIKRMNE